MTTEEGKFISNLFADLGKPPDEKESTAHKEMVYTSLKYGVEHLGFAIAKSTKRKAIHETKEVRGCAQVVLEPTDDPGCREWPRPYLGRDKEPKGVRPVVMPFVDGWWRPDGNGDFIKPDYNEVLIYEIFMKPLLAPLREYLADQIVLCEQRAKKLAGETLMDAFIRELLDFAVQHFWNHYLTQNRVVKSRRNKRGESENLTESEIRMEMRGLLLTINEETLQKRRERRSSTERPNLKMADTQRGRQWDPNEAYAQLESEEADRVSLERRFSEPQFIGGDDSLEAQATRLLAEHDAFSESQYAEIEY